MEPYTERALRADDSMRLSAAAALAAPRAMSRSGRDCRSPQPETDAKATAGADRETVGTPRYENRNDPATVFTVMALAAGAGGRPDLTAYTVTWIAMVV